MTRRRFHRTALIAATLSAAPGFAHGQTNTWTSAVSAFWSAGPWSNGVPSYGGGTSVGLLFTNPTASPYTASNDLGPPFVYGTLSLNNPGGGTITLDNAAGNLLGSAPGGTIAQTGAGPAVITGNLAIDNATITGPGAGALYLNGNLGGSTLSIAATGTVVLAGNNSTSATILHFGTLAVASNNAFGTGTLFVNGGVLSNPNPGISTPTIYRVQSPATLNAALTYNAPLMADLAFDSPISGTGSINVTGAGALRLTGSNTYTGGTNLNSGTTAFNARLIVSSANLGTGSVNFVGPGSGELIFSNLAGNTGTINVGSTATAFIAPGTDVTTVTTGSLQGSGTLILGLFSNSGTVMLNGASNPNTGPISIFSGVTRIDGAFRLGNSSTLLFDGGTLHPVGTMTINKPVVLADNTAVNVADLNTTTFSSSIALDPAHVNDALIKNGRGFMALGNIAIGPRVVVNSGSLAVSGGTFTYNEAGTPAVTINPGGTVQRTFFNALPDNSAIAMAGGTLQTSSVATFGSVSFTTNTQSVINAGGNTTFSGIVQPPGSSVLYLADGVGTTRTIKYTAAPSGSLLVGAGGAAGTPTISILAGSIGAGSFISSPGFVTYDAVNGVRKLVFPSEYTTSITDGEAALNNATLGVIGAPLTLPTTINSLTLQGGGSVAGNTTLTINSGMILKISTGFLSVSTLALGNANNNFTGLIIGDGAMSISSNIIGNALMIGGPVTLSGSNTYTGPTIITSRGQLSTSGSERIPNGSMVYVNGGGTFSVGTGNTETIAGLTQQDVVHSNGGSYGRVVLTNSTLTIGSGNVSSSFAGSILDLPFSAAIGFVKKIGSGTLTLSGTSSDFSGGLFIQEGMVRAEALPMANSPDGNPSNFAGATLATANADNILGEGTITLTPTVSITPQLRLGRNVTSLSRPISTTGSGTAVLSTDVDPQRGTPAALGPTITSNITIGNNTTLLLALSTGTMNGNIVGGASGSVLIDKAPGGSTLPTVTMRSSNSYTGTTTVRSGSLYLASNVNVVGISPVGQGALRLGDATTDAYAEIAGVNGGITIARGITTNVGTTGFTLALAGRSPRGTSVTYTGTITLDALPLRIFSGPNPVDGSVGSVSVNGPIVGAGSLLIGGGFNQSYVYLNSPSSTYSGGTTLSDGTLYVSASSGVGMGPLGTGPLTVAGASGIPALRTGIAIQQINNPLLLASDLRVFGTGLVAAGTADLGASQRTIEVNGPLTLTGAVSGSGGLNKSGASQLALLSSNTYSGPTSVFAGVLLFGASQNLSALNIGASRRANVSPGGDKVLRAGALNIAPGGTLDLFDEDAILDYTGPSPLTQIQQQIATGYNGGNWLGAGITSATTASVAANVGIPNKTAIGFAEASALGVGSFLGQSVDGSAILMRYTLSGDANLDGAVNGLDFNALSGNFGVPSRVWVEGDFNYDGQVNSLDFVALSVNFNSAIAASPALGAIIPEPGLATAALVIGVSLMPRRRRLGVA